MESHFEFEVSKDLNKILNCAVYIGEHRYPLIKEIAVLKSGLFRKQFGDQHTLKIDYDDANKDFQIIANLFCCSPITFNRKNIEYVISASQFFEIPELFEAASRFKNHLLNIENLLKGENNLNSLINIEKSIFNLSDDTFESTKSKIQEFLESKYDEFIVAKLIFKACLARSKIIPIIVKFVVEFDEVSKLFIHMVLTEFNTKKEPFLHNEINFILFYLLELGKISQDKILSNENRSLFWVHINENGVDPTFNVNQHLNRIKDGGNPDAIPTAIRNDDCDTLKDIYEKTHFDLNGRVNSSIYEIITFINKKQTYAEYSAFFGSTKCFSFLIENGARMPRYVFEVAVAGGHKEMIDLITQKQADLIKVYNNFCYNTILFHHTELFEWLLKEHPGAVTNLEIQASKCVDESSFSIFEHLLWEGIDPNGNETIPLLFSVVKNENLRLLQFLLQFDCINPNMKGSDGNSILHIACIEQKLDVVKFLMDNPKVEKNIRNVFSYLCIMFDFNIYNGMTPLELCCEHNYKEIVKLLLSYDDVDVNIVSSVLFLIL